MTNNRLGRGIETLIPQTPPKPKAETSANDITEVELGKLRVNPRQPRKHFDQEGMQELTDSIATKGVLQPLLVRQVGHHYEIIAGERRFRASTKAGLTKVPVHIVTMTDQEQLEAALIENIIREDLSAIETAKAFAQLQKEFSLTQEEIATRTGKDRSTIANLLRLLTLPTSIQKLVDEKKISMGHARALLRFGNQTHQEILVNLILEKGLSVRQVEQWKFHTPAKKKEKQAALSANIRSTVEDIQRKLGTKVLLSDEKKGKLTIAFHHPGELQKILSQLLK